ncbi:MAG: bifunctional adenosylcobinamide kinase/adenosylcobinamide-phosphate guanylyltransferase [Candidatus Omnitrophota bacterium]
MGKITFILGGARSGKSAYALKLAKKYKRIAFIATAQAKDHEMKKRIAIHKNSRPASWKTYEEPANVEPVIRKIGSQFEVIIIDCLTLLVSNLMLQNLKQKDIEKYIIKTCNRLKKIKANSIIVSNEVGLGIVPENKLARDFRDIAGRINQITAKSADEVFFMVSGIEWRIK